MKRMRGPAPSRRAQALPVQGRGKIGVGGHAGEAEFVEQKAEVRRRAGGVVLSSHGFLGVGNSTNDMGLQVRFSNPIARASRRVAQLEGAIRRHRKGREVMISLTRTEPR